MAKLVQGWIAPERIDEAAHVVTRELIPQFAAQPGAENGYWMANRDDGHVLIVMTWTDEAAVRDSRAADGRARARAAEQMGLRITAVETMRVIGAHESVTRGEAVWRWARATWVEGARVDADLDLSALRRDAVPDQMRSRGFAGSYWMADRDTGNGLALSFWERPADLRDGRAASRRRRRRVEEAIGCRIDLVTEYEAIGVVAVQHAIERQAVAVAT